LEDLSRRSFRPAAGLFDRMEVVSDDMRKLIEELWPELVPKLPPKEPHA